MRSSRQLSILNALRTQGRMTAHALAQAFNVSIRTIYRDMDELTAAGAPVYADRGREGGFQLLDGWKTRLDGLTDAEAETLFLGDLSGPAAQMGFSEAVSTLQLKLLAALPAERQAQGEKLAGRLHLDPVGWRQNADEADHLPTLAQAVWSERVVAVLYEGWKGETNRRLEPLGLILKGGAWYLAARPTDAGKEPRPYRVSNIRALSVTTEAFKRPAFDLADWWARSSGRFETSLFTGEARLRVTRAGLNQLADRGADYARRATAAPEGKRVEITVPIESIDRAAQDLLRLGPEVEVVAPPALREAIRARLKAWRKLYA